MSYASLVRRIEKEREQTLLFRSKLKDKQRHLPKDEPDGSIAAVHHSEVNMRKDVIDTSIVKCSASLPEDAINALSTILLAMYSFSSVYNLDICKLIDEPGFNHCVAIAESVTYVLTHL